MKRCLDFHSANDFYQSNKMPQHKKKCVGSLKIKVPQEELAISSRIEYCQSNCLQRREKYAVFRCHSNDEQFVVKVSQDCDSSRSSFVYSALEKNPHPNLIGWRQNKIVDKSLANFVLPYYSDGDLLKNIKINGPLPESKCQNLFLPLVKGLHHLHTNIKVAHMDISPENILKDKNRLILIDYGSCYKLDQQDKNRSLVMFKPEYMSPELLIKVRLNRYFNKIDFNEIDLVKADVFALGKVLFIALFGIPPFSWAEDRYYNYIKQNGVQSYLQKTAINNVSKVSKSVLSLINAMLQHDPQKRISVDNIIKHEWFRMSIHQSK